MCGISDFFPPSKQKIGKDLLIDFTKIFNHRGAENVGIYYENILGFAINLPLNDKIGDIRKFYNYKH